MPVFPALSVEKAELLRLPRLKAEEYRVWLGWIEFSCEMVGSSDAVGRGFPYTLTSARRTGIAGGTVL